MQTKQRYRNTRRLLWAAALAGGLTLTGCDRDAPPATDNAVTDALVSLESPQAEAATQSLWLQQGQGFAQILEQTRALQQAIDTLVDQPTEEHLQQARSQWHDAHNSLLRQSPTIAIGRINPGLFRQIQHSHASIGAQPIQPGYLDYFDVYQHTGIVNDIAAKLTAEDLRQQHQFSDNSDVSLGFHAIAYLLWGENQQRPVSDFQTPEALTQAQRDNGLKLVDLPQYRRGTLLQLQATLLLDDISALHYKLSHEASALNAAYQSLEAGTRMQLWLEASRFVLEKAAEQADLHATPNPDQPHDNYFSGGHEQALSATLTGLQQTLLDAEEGNVNLAQLLMPANTEALLKTLNDLQTALQSTEDHRPLAERDDVRQQLELLRTLLGDKRAPTSNE